MAGSGSRYASPASRPRRQRNAPTGPLPGKQLQQLAPTGSEVSLRVQTQDRCSRTVAEVFRNGQSINLAMVCSGQAFVYRQYLRQCDRTAYLGTEAAAQKQALGVWSVPGGLQRPCDWRHASRPSSGGGSGSGDGQRYTCKQIGSFARAQELLRQGHSDLDRNGMAWRVSR